MIEQETLIRSAEMAGVSYRRVDYWIRNGVIVPEVPATGSGTRAKFTLRQVQILAWLAAVSDAVGGLSGSPGASNETLREFARRFDDPEVLVGAREVEVVSAGPSADLLVCRPSVSVFADRGVG